MGVLLAAFLLLVSGCGQQAKLPLLAPDAIVVAFGDSLTYGTGANEEESYPAQLARITGRRVVREGVPGEVSATGLARLPAALDEHQPRLLILCHGGNDFLRRLPKEQAAENVRAMIRLAKDRGVEVLLIGTPEIGFTLTPPEFYAGIAKQFGIPYEGDVLTKILRNGELKSDQIHPNAQGYRLMAERVAELLRKSGAI
ncbi:MAG: arylesterase [Betaproteobacteria bacterium RBG_16_66_20]|nr:MAG: arylesterase [Betaproteobacteria bacterium RBG_16_66_20]